MNWLISPNAFKGTIEADEAAEIIKRAILEVNPNDQVQTCPIADGGDGTCFLLSEILGLEKIHETAGDPLGSPKEGFFSLEPSTKTAFLDVSTVSGIKWLREVERDPWVCSTYGTGELILAALERGVEQVVIGLGGSATVDMGLGMLQALGISFLNDKGREIRPFTPDMILKIKHIQLSPKLPTIKFTFLCDVNNYFFGENGAIPVFGPQKGLKEEDKEKFEKASAALFQLLQKKSRKPLRDQAGFGAAGGIALGISAFFESELLPGAPYFFQKVGIPEKLKWADVVLTGEGKYDMQSAQGKGSYELMRMAKQEKTPIWLISAGEEGKNAGFDRYIQLPDLDFAMAGFELRAKENLFNVVKEAASS
ncbi:glycerate kinase family protein [Pleomorphovibrio marinus]|uniref:glycerate kinase family protein n=1 Tax=Pleomorphovibrio marinus TaxID=2164132 RepID=UPI000E0AC6A4|nr:glycerate kinase [Pleomorphovibrio marinus]